MVGFHRIQIPIIAITSIHPCANGLVERKNKEIARMIKKYMQGSYGGWEHWLSIVQLALNAKISVRTKSSPFVLMFGRPFNNFVDYHMSSNPMEVATFTAQRLQQVEELKLVDLTLHSRMFQREQAAHESSIGSLS